MHVFNDVYWTVGHEACLGCCAAAARSVPTGLSCYQVVVSLEGCVEVEVFFVSWRSRTSGIGAPW